MISEITAARIAGESINWARVGGKGLATSIVYGFAAVPGALHADYRVQHQHDGAGDGNYRVFKKGGTVKAEQLTQNMEWKSTNGDTLTGQAGDHRATAHGLVNISATSSTFFPNIICMNSPEYSRPCGCSNSDAGTLA